MWELELSRENGAGLSRQICNAFRERILAGLLRAGEPLPSTRALADSLGVSRNTVCEAFDLLWAEGYTVRRQGAPTRVAEGLRLPDETRAKPAPPMQPAAPYRWDFLTGQPDLAAFPWAGWRRSLQTAARLLPPESYAYGDPQGYAPLRGEIARWLLRSRGLWVPAEHVYITAGTTHALHVLAPLLARPGRAMAMEWPSHEGIRAVAAARGMTLCPVPVDAQGAQVALLEGVAVSAMYVTPSHQYPLGVILTAGRRAALVRMAREQDFYIIEDDYDSEFRYAGLPISPMAAMEPTRVIYMGTFSKTLFPALRIGFAVLPPALREAFLRARRVTDVQNPVLEQAALADFLAGGQVDRHVRHMRSLYGSKRQTLLRALSDVFGDTAAPWGDASGLHIALAFPGRTLGEGFTQTCAQAGLRVETVARHAPGQAEHADKLLLGYGHLSHAQIWDGVKALGACIRAYP